MEKATRRCSRHDRFIATCGALCAGFVLAATSPAQEPAQQAETPEELEAAAAELGKLVDEASALVDKGDLAGARALCQLALERADLERASDAWLAAAATELWKLGSRARRAGDLRIAHDAWEALHGHRARTLPDDHPDLQVARLNLANIKQMLGDPHGALALQEQVLAVYARTLPDDHPDLQWARSSLAYTKYVLGDLHGALTLQEQVLAVRSRTLPDDHPDLLAARGNLANTKYALGDLHGALTLQEQVLAAFARTLPDDHPDLQVARSSLAITKYKLGDLHGALALEEQVLAIRSRTLPDDHPDLQQTRGSLADIKYMLGDLHGALTLREQRLAAYLRTLPDDHPLLQSARGSLAATKSKLGDLHGALALEEKVLAVCSCTLPDDHPDLQRARLNHAATKAELGDLTGALALEEQALAVFARTLPDDDPDLQVARCNLAITKSVLGDLHGALGLEEQVLAAFSRTLPEDHPDLQAARLNLAWTKTALGDLHGALALQEQTVAAFVGTLPDDHPDLQTARLNLANTKKALGDLSAAAQLHHSAVRGALRRLSTAPISTRDVAELAVAATNPLSQVGSLLAASKSAEDPLPAKLAASLAHEALALLTAARSAQGHATELLRTARAAAGEALTEVLLQIAAANKALDEAVALPPEGRTDRGGQKISRTDAIRDATLAKDAAERALLATVPAELRAQPTAEALAEGLAKAEAAVAFLTYTLWTNDTEKPWITTSEKCFAAFLLAPSGDVTWHSLAPVAEVEPLIRSIRALAFAGSRGERLEGDVSLDDQLTALRRLLFDPVLEALPAGTERIVLSLADELQLVPVEDLPFAVDQEKRSAIPMQVVPSLRSLLARRPDAGAKPTVLTLGSVDYDHAPATPAPVVAGAATPIVADGPGDPTRGADAGGPGENNTPKAFPPLFNTEASRVGKLFGWAIDGATAPTVLRETDASEAAFVAQAPGKTFLHLATHGYFAPESAWRATDARDPDEALARFDVGRDDRVAQLSPFSLTGIALAGANLPPDALGRREGILTAQEIAQLDLTSCYLATLSACNTSLGVRRGGTGLASLRQAFHAAGARFVLATLWEVNDVHAEALMTDFYTRLWQHGEEPRAALRAAKRAARQRGVPFRDWAGWMITGR